MRQGWYWVVRFTHEGIPREAWRWEIALLDVELWRYVEEWRAGNIGAAPWHVGKFLGERPEEV